MEVVLSFGSSQVFFPPLIVDLQMTSLFVLLLDADSWLELEF
jgi:hypothetical protein